MPLRPAIVLEQNSPPWIQLPVDVRVHDTEVVVVEDDDEDEYRACAARSWARRIFARAAAR
jgi:hypothetical protein